MLWHCCLQLSFIYKKVSQILFNLFCLGDKRLLSEFLRKCRRFQGHNERFLKYLDVKLKFQKTETQFREWKSTDNNDINIFLSLENPFTFLLAKEKTWKRILNTNSEFSQNRTEKQIMPSKTAINWLFNDIWCYLFFVLIEKLFFLFFKKQLQGFIIKSKNIWHKSREIWLHNSTKLTCMDQSRFYISSHPQQFKVIFLHVIPIPILI